MIVSCSSLPLNLLLRDNSLAAHHSYFIVSCYARKILA